MIEGMSRHRLIFVILTIGWTTCSAFAPPTFGIGAVLFPVRGLTIQGLFEESESKRGALQDASDFFVDAFWTAKVGGGSRSLTAEQVSTLRQSQFAEFNKRYGGRSKRNVNLLVAKNGRQDIVACAGVEVDRIPTDSLKGPIEKRAPLMSNLAVSRQYRRRGLAEKLVENVETLVRDDWGFDECFLYVEERNQPAVKLYQKLGYRKLWRDGTAMTLMPTQSGTLQTEGTVIVCMRKSLKPGPWKFF